MLFLLIDQFIFSCSCMIKPDIILRYISYILAIRRLRDSPNFNPFWVIRQLFHLTTFQIHFK